MVSPDDIAELWEAVNGLRADNAKILAAIEGLRASIEGRNQRIDERCEYRAEGIEAMNVRIRALEDKYHLLDKTVLRVSIITSAISAFFSSTATGIAVISLGKFVGK